MVDDRGNVVDIYVGDSEDSSGRIDREAEPIPGVNAVFTYGWVGDTEEMKEAIELSFGIQGEVAVAIICGLLRGEAEAIQDAKNYLNLFFGE